MRVEQMEETRRKEANQIKMGVKRKSGTKTKRSM